MFTLFLGTGCRVGEIVGLRWEDCDFKQRIININHTLIYRLQDDGRVEYHITTPKTEAGIREIPMMDEVYDALIQLKNWRVLVGDAHDEIDGYSGFILTTRFGNVCNPPYHQPRHRADVQRLQQTGNRAGPRRRATAYADPPLFRTQFTPYILYPILRE